MTKLILIEGLPGSGKSTTAVHVSTFLTAQGVANQLFDEGQYEETVGLFDPASPTYQTDLLNQWQKFVEQWQSAKTIAVMEAQFWQNTGSYMLDMGYAPSKIIAIIQSLGDLLSALDPVLIYLALDNRQESLANHLTWLHEQRGNAWAEMMTARFMAMPYYQARNELAFECRVSFMRECHELHEALFERFPFSKYKIDRPHRNWYIADHAIHEFLLRTVVCEDRSFE